MAAPAETLGRPATSKKGEQLTHQYRKAAWEALEKAQAGQLHPRVVIAVNDGRMRTLIEVGELRKQLIEDRRARA